MKTSLSVLVPVYNEQHLVYESLKRLKILDTSEHLERIEVIVVDDCSKDASAKVLETFREEQTREEQTREEQTREEQTREEQTREEQTREEQTREASSKIQWIFLRHEQN